ncbi:MAG: YidC/Oxa1 family membrane protein insertase, partial [Evtepia gabavorous]|uniref:YidC/Oxa1 family membrane protein insertase n=1 Tax=Evtepia gabavorous TaxID=2211183 RepID=UPI002E77D8FA
MSTIMHWLGIPLGYIMYFCYHVAGNYALAILLFTLVTKVILLPVAIWVQKNGIKIVKLTPELNHIKANFLGDHDRIAEETQKLYKREKYNAFANLIPTFVQLILLI